MIGKPERKTRIFTLGHSNRTIDEFLTILERSSVRLVADVRSNPASARFPWFERNALANALDKRGLSYRWFRELGGRQPPSPEEVEHTGLSTDVGLCRYAAAMNTPGFKAAVDELLGQASSAITVALCAEQNYRDCHRMLLADSLQLAGARVVHILGADEAEEHSINPDLVQDGERFLYRRRQLDLI